MRSYTAGRPQMQPLSFDEFVEEDDQDTFGPPSSRSTADDEISRLKSSMQTLHIPIGHSASAVTVATQPPPSPEITARVAFPNFSRQDTGQTSHTPSTHREPLAPLLRMCNLHIATSVFASVHDLYLYLKKLDLPKEDRMRPTWDRYFMTLAGLASLR